MVRKRPPSVLVIAILNMAIGGFWLAYSLCQGIGFAIMYVVPLTSNTPGADPLLIYKKIPGYTAFLIANESLTFVLSAVLIIAGIGLLRMKTWGRWASVLSCVVAILLQSAGVLYQLVYANPRVAEAISQLGQGPMPTFLASPTLYNISAIVSAFLRSAYPIALIILMFLPGIRAAFAAPSSQPVDAPEDYCVEKADDGSDDE